MAALRDCEKKVDADNQSCASPDVQQPLVAPLSLHPPVRCVQSQLGTNVPDTKMSKLKPEKAGSLGRHIQPGQKDIIVETAVTPKRRVKKRAGPPQADCSSVRELPMPCILDRHKEDWTENLLYAHFTSAKEYPSLVEIEDMLVRLQGVHKFRCGFLNRAGQLCKAWVTASILYESYPTEYKKYILLFFNKLQKAHQLSSRS